jgi:hypothetical protein
MSLLVAWATLIGTISITGLSVYTWQTRSENDCFIDVVGIVFYRSLAAASCAILTLCVFAMGIASYEAIGVIFNSMF